MAPKESPKPTNHAAQSAAPITAAHYMAGQIMSRNDPTKPPGLAGQCFDDDVPSEDELLDVHMRPRYHFWHGKTWAECINPIKRLKLAGCRPWQRGKTLTAELDPLYLKQVKINRARQNALKLLENIESVTRCPKETPAGLAASADPVLKFVQTEVKQRLASNAMIPPPPPMDEEKRNEKIIKI